MKFALLGFDDSIGSLIRSLVAEHVHIVGLYSVGDSQGEPLRRLCPTADWYPDWSDALALDPETIVIAGRDSLADDRIEPLRKLIQAGQPLIVSHPLVDSMVDCFELEMIRADGGGVLVPWTVERWHPAFARIKQSLQDKQFGALDQIIVEHAVNTREPRAVLRTFMRDMHLVRGWIGELTKVAAFAAAPTDYSGLGVQLTGPAGTLVRWTSQLSQERRPARITFVGTKAKGILECEAPASDWRWHWQPTGHASAVANRRETNDTSTEISAATSEAQALIAHLERLVAGERLAPTWLDACREVELADAVERSATKGRTIELYLEEVGEQSTFKGMMAAGGCGLLLLTILLVVCATTLKNLGVPWVDGWPYLLVGVLAAFLLLQTLRFAFPQEPR